MKDENVFNYVKYFSKKYNKYLYLTVVKDLDLNYQRALKIK